MRLKLIDNVNYQDDIYNCSEQQRSALTLLDDWLNTRSQVFRLSGYSGTGKSYLMKLFVSLINEVASESNSTFLIAAIAPSHKAKKNLSANLPDNLSAITISSFLGLCPDVNVDNGKQEFKVKKNEVIDRLEPEDYDLVIVDEYSMISKEQVLLLLDRCRKILFLGDPAQLPPVGEKIPHVWDLECPTVELTQVMRYSGDLAKVADSWRSTPPKKIAGTEATFKVIRTNPLPIDQTFDNTIERLSKYDWITNYTELVDSWVKGASEVSKLIAWQNKTCERWNKWVRYEIFEGNDPYCKGDKLIARKPLFRETPKTAKNKKDDLSIAFENSSEFSVLAYDGIQQIVIKDEEYNYYDIHAVSDKGIFTKLKILTPESIADRQVVLDRVRTQNKIETDYNKKKQRWSKFYLLMNSFDDIGYNYAITAHKSQGSTYDSIYLDLTDLMKCPDRKQIVYTALTRSKQAYIYL